MNMKIVLPHSLIFLERGWLSSNNVLLIDETSTTLIDSGYCLHSEQTLQLVLHHLQERPLHRLINTHLHSDHCGGNARLQQHFPELLTAIPQRSAQDVLQWDREALSFDATGQSCPVFTFQHTLQPGDRFSAGSLQWDVHAAPGHDPHSLLLFNTEHRILISADALWENGFGVVFPEIEGVAAFDEVADTLDLIEALQPRVVLPGHGAPFTDVSKALAVARQRLNGFKSDPRKHAIYASKVLIKFKLLELQTVSKPDFLLWANATPYLKRIHANQDQHASFEAWFTHLLDELQRSKALLIQETLIQNI